MNYANFVHRPRRVSEIQEPGVKARYEIVKTVRLGMTDFENFSEDLLADRIFLEGILASDPVAFQCVLVQPRNRQCGILVVPTDDGHVKYAAIYK